jgi:hypothetical protein
MSNILRGLCGFRQCVKNVTLEMMKIVLYFKPGCDRISTLRIIFSADQYLRFNISQKLFSDLRNLIIKRGEHVTYVEHENL